MKRKKDKLLSWVMLFTLLCSTVLIPVNEIYAASHNDVNRVITVKSDHIFNDPITAPTLRIKEEDVNEFCTKQQIFQLKLENAQWLTDDDFSGSTFEQEMKSLCEDLIITRLEDTTVAAQVYNNTPNRIDKLIFKIPMLVKVQGEGAVKVSIDSKNSALTSGMYSIAHASNLDTVTTIEDVNTFNDTTQIETVCIKEVYIGALPTTSDKKIRVKLSNGFKWIAGGTIEATAGLKGTTGITAINGDTLEITMDYSKAKDRARRGTISLEGASIKALPEATSGDVEIAVSGDNITEVQFVIASYDKKKPVIEVAYPVDQSTMFMNGKEMPIDCKTHLIDNNMYVHIKPLAEGLGIKSTDVSWDGATRTIAIFSNDKVVQLTIGSSEMQVNERIIDIGVEPKVIAGRTYIPAKYVFQAFGFKVSEENNILKATKNDESNKKDSIIRSEYPVDQLIMYLHGTKITTNTQNKLIDDHIYVPVYSIEKGLGTKSTEVSWDGATRTISILRKGKTVKLVIDSSEMKVNEKVIDMGVAPKIINGRIYIPAKYVFEVFDFKVSEDNKRLKATNDSSFKEVYTINAKDFSKYKQSADFTLDLSKITITNSDGNQVNKTVTLVPGEVLSKYIIDNKIMKISKDIPVGVYKVTAILDEDKSIKATFKLTISNKPSSGSSGGSGGSSGGGGGGSSASKTVDKTDNQSIEKALKDKKEVKLSLKDKKEAKAQISLSVLDKVIESGKPLKVENKGVSLAFSKQTLPIKDLKNSGEDTSLEVSAKAIDKATKDKILSKAIDNTGLFKVDSEVFELSCSSVSKKRTTKIVNFNEPVAVTIDLTDKNLSKEDIKNLTGIRYEKDEKGNIIPVKLGGNYDSNTKTFTFYTNQFSLYGVLKAQNLRKINLTIDDTYANINNTPNTLDLPPTIINSRTMVPLRFVAEALGANVKWIEQTKTVQLELENKNLNLVIGKKQLGMDVPALIKDGRTLVPIRYVSENLGANVLWFPSSKKIEIVK